MDSTAAQGHPHYWREGKEDVKQVARAVVEKHGDFSSGYTRMPGVKKHSMDKCNNVFSAH